MNINRNNYEEYFILYLDNELDSESRREVEAFAQQNPDLKAEMEILLQSKLVPDADISFTEKGSLMRFDSASISLSNYEEWLTSYIDDELTAGERNDVEVFVAGNPAIQRELNLLQQTKLQPETIVFPYKESLYRKEEKARVISVRWWRIAAAAVLLLGISTTAIVLINNNNKQIDIAKGNDQPKEVKSTDNILVKQPGSETDKKQVTDDTNQKKIEPVRDQKNLIANKQNKIKSKEKKEQPSPIEDEKPLIAYKNKEDNQAGNLSQSTIESNHKIEPEQGTTVVPKNKAVSDESSLTKIKDNIDFTKVTDETSQPSYAVEQQSSAKGGLRGFLRKVTRTIEKRTNIKATDDDDRLLVAGLAIKL